MTMNNDMAEQLARRIRAVLGEFNDDDVGVETLVRELAEHRRAHLTQPAQAVDVGYDDALNDAGWAFIEAMQYQLPGPIFNNVKPALKAAIEKWLATRALGTAQEGLTSSRQRMPQKTCQCLTVGQRSLCADRDRCSVATTYSTPPTDGEG